MILFFFTSCFSNALVAHVCLLICVPYSHDICRVSCWLSSACLLPWWPFPLVPAADQWQILDWNCWTGGAGVLGHRLGWLTYTFICFLYLWFLKTNLVLERHVFHLNLLIWYRKWLAQILCARLFTCLANVALVTLILSANILLEETQVSLKHKKGASVCHDLLFIFKKYVTCPWLFMLSASYRLLWKSLTFFTILNSQSGFIPSSWP